MKANYIDRNALMQVVTPPSTKTHRPVPHYDVATEIVGHAVQHGFTVSDESYALAGPEGSQLFGKITLGHPELGMDGWTQQLGFRSSHDKTFALKAAAAGTVIVCSNGLLSGDVMGCNKHTSGVDVHRFATVVFGNVIDKFNAMQASIDRMKGTAVDMDEAKRWIVTAAQNNRINSQDIIPVLNLFEKPPHEEFEGGTQWGLYNAFTENAKKYNIARLTRMMDGCAQDFRLGLAVA